ncbi:MAG: hypothetical protein E2O45_04835 [Nitrospina sp.]|nr:MAG: hypothetical protein E2O45_04835 [Nitrospina sp.]
MRQINFLGISFAMLALLGLMESGQALAAYSAAPDFSMNRPLAASPSEGTFKLAVTVGNETLQLALPEKPAETAVVPKPEKTKKKEIKKASKPKKKKVKTAQSKKSEAQKAQVKKPEKEEESFLTKTLKLLVGGDDAKKEDASQVKLEKASGKAPEKEEPGLLTKTLKKLIGGDDDQKIDPEKAKQNPLNPLNIAPTVSATQKQKEDKPEAQTAKTETQATLKGSFKKLIGVDAAKDKAKTLDTVVKSSGKEESGVTAALKKILGGGDKKDPPAGQASPAKTRQAKQKESGTAKQAQAETSEEPAVKRASGPTGKYLGKKSEEAQLEEDRGGVKKGKNILKESFKTLVADDKKEEAEE